MPWETQSRWVSRHPSVDAFRVVICWWKSVLLCIWVNIMMILLVPFLSHQHLHVTEVEHISLTLYLSAMSPRLVFDFQMGRLVVLVVHPTSSLNPFCLELTQSRCWLNHLPSEVTLDSVKRCETAITPPDYSLAFELATWNQLSWITANLGSFAKRLLARFSKRSKE